tara:strand:+ start:321 stop:614 length:294 start_codon:yes stop_codon:yes gene_type:complete
MLTLKVLDSKEISALMSWKMSLLVWLLTVALLVSCSSNVWHEEYAESVNDSALYDPPTITLVEGVPYDFVEGTLIGRKNHKFHSDYSYQRAIIIGDK